MGKDGKRPKARTMSFSVAGDNCEPGAATREKAEKFITRTTQRIARTVDPSMILVPRLWRRAQLAAEKAKLNRTEGFRSIFRI